ncbi:MAG: UMP kinase [Acidimicrobiia bacterium]|nr:UMP kinase [Acidimicrobiia bacterium]
MNTPQWRRVLLKISGQAFTGSLDYGIDTDTVNRIAQDIVSVKSYFDIEIAVVVGGGNIWRGVQGAHDGMDLAQADYMGMLSTVMNGLALQDTMERFGVDTRLQSAVHMAQIAEPYIRRRAIRHLEKGRIVILASGTGNPGFTTDTAASLRAVEIEAEAVLKGTHGGIDGIYTNDPNIDSEAVKLDHVTYLDVVNQGLKVMDTTAITLCMENQMPIVVFDLMGEGNLQSVLEGKGIGTLVNSGDTATLEGKVSRN